MGAVPPEVRFIFGHTHKPFVEDWSVTDYPGPVRLRNTGGWVVDSATPAPTQGGAAVLLDDDLHAATLLFYQQSPDGRASPPKLLASAGVEPNPLQASLAAAVDPANDVWGAVGSAAADLVAQRHRSQQSLLGAQGSAH
jgi:hypothetical protein